MARRDKRVRRERVRGEGLTFDDVLLVPRYSEVLPGHVDVSTLFSRNIALALPLVSAAMDTVTESVMAIEMARRGGLGVIHKNLSIESQAAEVREVKASPVNSRRNPHATVDSSGRLRVAAAIGVSPDVLERASALVESGADALVLDSAHGHTKGVMDAVRLVRSAFPRTDLVAGNVGTKDGAKALAGIGVDAIKVGIGSGASCTTRVIAGIGVPQLTAVLDCVEVTLAKGIPVISDGGVRTSGDIAKAIAAGASCVMLGRILAGTDESPGDVTVIEGTRYKSFRGMGSLGPMQERSADRYFQQSGDKKKLVPEGIEGIVACQGSAADVLYQMVGGLRAAMGYCGCETIQAMGERTEFLRISQAGVIESHPHDVRIIKEAPNYKSPGAR